jgi:hypothetical protein
MRPQVYDDPIPRLKVSTKIANNIKDWLRGGRNIFHQGFHHFHVNLIFIFHSFRYRDYVTVVNKVMGKATK